MILTHLYRYIFCEWDKLTAEEVASAAEFFNPYIQNPRLEPILRAYETARLYNLLFHSEIRPSYPFFHPMDKLTLSSTFKGYHKKSHYFNESTVENNRQIFITLCGVLEIFNELLAKPYSIPQYNIPWLSYSLLLVFGADDLQTTLKRIDEYCNSQASGFVYTLFHSIINIDLNPNSKKIPISLTVWRKLAIEMGLPAGLRLLMIAPEIEAILQDPPSSLEQAMDTAKAKTFVQQSGVEAYAKQCVEYLIPEELFNKSIDKKNSVRVEAVCTIAKQLTVSELETWLPLSPSIELDCNQLVKLLDVLPSHQITIINHYSYCIPKAIKNTSNLSMVLKHLANGSIQQALFNCLGQDFIQTLMSQLLSIDFGYILKALDRDFLEAFYCQVLGADRVQATVNSSYVLQILLQNGLPKDNQVAFLKKIIGVEKIRSLCVNFISVVDQLKCINTNEYLNYLKEIIGSELLNQVCENWCTLESLLMQVPVESRWTVMHDIIGMDGIRKILPVCGGGRARRAICLTLGSVDYDSFVESISTEEEKNAKRLVRDTKQKIMDHEFTLGFWGMGYGGANIQLDDRSNKKVPETVAKQWLYIQDAEHQIISYLEAWEHVQKLGAEVKPTKYTSNYFFRATDTNEYYNSFRTTPQPN